MAAKIKVLTLNCWGVPIPHFGSKLRPERFEAIGKNLAKADYDIVLLQEVWSQSDYDTLCAQILTVMPHTHYFHSGVIGSGLCVFSKHPILETQSFPYTLNGYAHKVLHGDWYGRKAVGLCKVLVRGIRVNAYVTHLHADYNNNSLYDGQRATQAFELSQVVKNTSDTCDLAVVTGDLNYTSDSPGYRIIVSNGNLLDAWGTQRRKVANQDEGWTVNRPDNSFRPPKSTGGDRIDYILYRNNAGYSVDCETCHVTMQRVPDQTYNFSDHCASISVLLTVLGYSVDCETCYVTMQRVPDQTYNFSDHCASISVLLTVPGYSVDCEKCHVTMQRVPDQTYNFSDHCASISVLLTVLGYSVDCETCHVTMQRVPDQTYNFSDHEAVAAEFNVRKNITAMSPPRDSGQIEKDLLDVSAVVDRGLTKVKSDRIFFLVACFLCVVGLVYSAGVATEGCCALVIECLRKILVVVIAFFVWTALIVSKIEISGMLATKRDIDNLVKSNPGT